MYDIVIGRKPRDKEKFGLKGTILLGKHYVQMGQTTSLSNKVLMDVTSSHVLFICGKRGSGKCLHGDTLITLDNGDTIPIKDLDNDTNRILGLNHSLKIVSNEKQGFYKRETNKLFEVRLRSGKTINLTPDHPLLKIEGWVPTNRLKVGDRIATPRAAPYFGTYDISESEVKILAYLIAEGHLGKKIFFTNTDSKLVNDFKQAIATFDNTLNVRSLKNSSCQFDITSSKKRKVLDYHINRDVDGRFLEGSYIKHEKTSIRILLEKTNLYKKKSGDKTIPKCILKLPKHKLSIFLNRLFSCDGSIYKKKCTNSDIWQVSYSSSSKKLIHQVQHLLLRFGILCRIRKKKHKLNQKTFITYEIVFSSENVEKFIHEIGFFGDKQTKQSKALVEINSVKRNPNIDTIPKEIWDYYRPQNWAEIGREMGYSTPKALRSSINYAPSRQKLLQIAELDNNKRIKALAGSDIFWDEIVEINKFNGSFEVYDISVPNLHNFTANDIIVHNSYSMGVVAEGMVALPEEIAKKLSIIMLDTMGIYWTMKYPNEQDRTLLEKWGMEPKGLDVQIYTPKGYFQQFKDSGVPTDFPFSIQPSELAPEDWCTTFELDVNEPHGVLIMRAISEIKNKIENYSLQDIIDLIKTYDDHGKEAAINRFETAKSWGLFDKEGTKLKDLINPGKITVLDVSCYATTAGSNHIRSLVIGLVAEKLFVARMIARRTEEYQSVHKSMSPFSQEDSTTEEPLVWLVIDEAHEFLPREGSTLASGPLITILREGRQPGISLILASQQPGKIHTDVMTQSDTVISHRLTAKLDVEALGMLMQSYMQQSLDKYINELPREKGSAIVFDDTNERIFPIRVRPRLTWHGGSAPTALKQEKKFSIE